MLTDSLVLSDLVAQARDGRLAWQPFRDGIDISRLYQEAEGPAAALLRYAPGSKVPPHRHTGYEHLFILSGSQSDARGLYQAGALVINPPGSMHAVESPEGCLVLAIWERPVSFLDP